MKKNLRDSLFGFRRNLNNDVAAIKRETTLSDINELGNTSSRPRVRRTIGITEARLRARNKPSWMTSTKGWSEFFSRFISTAKVAS